MAYHSILQRAQQFDISKPVLYRVVVSKFNRIKKGDIIRFCPALNIGYYTLCDIQGTPLLTRFYGDYSRFQSVFEEIGPVKMPSTEEMYKELMG